MQSNLCFHLVHIRCNGYGEITVTKSHIRNMEEMYESPYQTLPALKTGYNNETDIYTSIHEYSYIH